MTKGAALMRNLFLFAGQFWERAGRPERAHEHAMHVLAMEACG